MNAAAHHRPERLGGAAAVRVYPWSLIDTQRPSWLLRSCRFWAQQRNCCAMPNDLWQLWIVTPTQGEHVVIYFNDNGFPPSVRSVSFSGDHQMTNLDVVPTGRQACGRRGTICRSIAVRRHDQ